ncbi:hypothetical protein [Vallitalea guaymasensis]|uniref:hypothetical protein n=1 Tax=Vallitalea guaymasensis TaxID=1185412 RepID=UPI00272A93BE|nr:hypothetical protein [Vallitalea guaymasensis]
MKKYIIILILVTIGIAFFWYNGTYKINEDEIDKNVTQFVNRKNDNDSLKINIEESVDIGYRRIVCFTTDNGLLGEAFLKKGINKRFKIEWTGYGNNIYRHKVIKIGNKKYFTVIGRNYDLQIAKIIGNFKDKTYELEVPQQEYFIIYCEVENNFSEHPAIRLFDSNNNDITDDIYEAYSLD